MAEPTKESNGTFYHEGTADKVVQVLDRFMHDRDVRLRLYFGDATTGKDWEERYDIEGYIGRSTGSAPIPILLHNSRSIGGGAILDYCIIKIEYANKKRGGVLYEHPLYHKLRWAKE